MSTRLRFLGKGSIFEKSLGKRMVREGTMRVRDERLKFLAEDAVQGFTEYVGLVPVLIEPGKFITRVRLQKHHLQQDGFVHAGLIATLADHTAGYASYTLVPRERRILTVEYKINFLKPALGDFLECRAKVIKPGKQILVAESEIFCIQGKEETLVAKALLTMASLPGNKLPKGKGRKR